MQSTRLINKIKKLQTYKMFEGEKTKYVGLEDVIKVIEEYKMTLDETRKEVDRLGYMVVKRNYTKLLPCLCGCNKRRRVVKDGSYYIECKECEKYVTGANLYQAVENWNKVMVPEKKEISEARRKQLSDAGKARWAKKKEEENEPESRETV